MEDNDVMTFHDQSSNEGAPVFVTARAHPKKPNGKAEQSRLTKERILVASRRLFLEEGFLTTTMAAIARESGVAVQTLYLAFGSKNAILQAAFDEALKGDAEPEDLPERAWFRQVLNHGDGPEALRLFCAEAAHVIGRAAPLFACMRAAAGEPEIGELLAHNKDLRLRAHRQVIEALAQREGFSEDLSLEDALTVLYTVVSEDTYVLMVHECGWSSERWRTWVFATCLTQFFPRSPNPPSGAGNS